MEKNQNSIFYMHSKKLQSSVSTPKHKKCSETLKHGQEKCIGKPLGRQLARRSKHFLHVWTLSRRLTKLGWNSGQQLREWTSFNPGSTLSCGCLNFLQFLGVQNSCLATALPLEINQSTVIMDLLLQSAWSKGCQTKFCSDTASSTGHKCHSLQETASGPTSQGSTHHLLL